MNRRQSQRFLVTINCCSFSTFGYRENAPDLITANAIESGSLKFNTSLLKQNDYKWTQLAQDPRCDEEATGVQWASRWNTRCWHQGEITFYNNSNNINYIYKVLHKDVKKQERSHTILITGNISATLLSENILLQLQEQRPHFHLWLVVMLFKTPLSELDVVFPHVYFSRMLSDLIVCVLWSSSWPEALRAVVIISQKVLTSQVEMRAERLYQYSFSNAGGSITDSPCLRILGWHKMKLKVNEHHTYTLYVVAQMWQDDFISLD